MAAVVEGVGVSRAGFFVFENGSDDGLHIASDAAAVVGEDGGDAGNIGRARVALDEMLDQLPADEGAYIRVVEDIGERAVEVLFGGLAGGKHGAVEDGL